MNSIVKALLKGSIKFFTQIPLELRPAKIEFLKNTLAAGTYSENQKAAVEMFLEVADQIPFKPFVSKLKGKYNIKYSFKNKK